MFYDEIVSKTCCETAAVMFFHLDELHPLKGFNLKEATTFGMNLAFWEIY